MATVSGETTSERFGVRYLCDWPGVSSSGYYAWLKREPFERKKEGIELLEQIWSAHSKNRKAYGSPRIHYYLKNKGIIVGKNRVARLMRENGIKGRVVTVTQRRSNK